MEEFGDWIYIIIMVVVGISSLFSSINKKKAQQQTQMPSSEPLDPSFPDSSVPKKKEKKQPPPVPKQIKRQPFNMQSTIPTVETDSQTEKYLMQEKESALVDELDLDDPDSFRKAIIYSEILHRKY